MEFQDYEDIDEKDCESDAKAKVLPLNASAAMPPTSENSYDEAPGLLHPPIPQQTYDSPRPGTPKQTYDLIAPHQPYDNITLQNPPILQKVCGHTFLKPLSLNNTLLI